MATYITKEEKIRRLLVEMKNLLNSNSAENGSNTPDFILAEYLLGCLHEFDKAVTARNTWYGGKDTPWTTVISKDSP